MKMAKAVSKTPLKPFKEMISKRYSGSSEWNGLGRALAEENDEMKITQSTTMLIGSDASPLDRAQVIKGFTADIANFEGETIIGVAVVLK